MTWLKDIIDPTYLSEGNSMVALAAVWMLEGIVETVCKNDLDPSHKYVMNKILTEIPMTNLPFI